MDIELEDDEVITVRLSSSFWRDCSEMVIHTKGFSFTDAVGEVVVGEFGLTLISFDSGFGVKTVGGCYWLSLDENERKRTKSIVRKYRPEL